MKIGLTQDQNKKHPDYFNQGTKGVHFSIGIWHLINVRGQQRSALL